MTPEELKAIEERCENATPGPWKEHRIRDNGLHLTLDNGLHLTLRVVENPGVVILCSTDGTQSDLEFISHARQDIPKLLAEVVRLKQTIQDIDEPKPLISNKFGDKIKSPIKL